LGYQSDEFLLKLRNANPIETVMGSYVNLIRRGRNYVCCCPFHSEKTPSCTAFTETQSFYCFGCQSGGDVITFTMKIENLSFREAIEFLAQKSGLTIPDNNDGGQDNSKRKARIYEINRIASEFFLYNLIKGSDKRGLEYLVSRGITPQTVKKYQLGYSSDSWQDLYNHLLKKNYTEDEIIDAWLCTNKKRARF